MQAKKFSKVFLAAVAASVVSTAAVGQGETQPAAEGVDFKRDVLPILEARCMHCHGADRQRGRLRLDAREHVFGGEEEDWVIAPGKPDESELFRRITLPADDFDIMPADGDPLTADEIASIRAWIESGATWPESAESAEPKEEEIALPELTPEQAARVSEAVVRLQEHEVVVLPIAAGSPALYVNMSLLAEKANDETVRLLDGLQPVLVWLNLGRTAVTDDGVRMLRTFPHLKRLRLHRTAVTDAGLAHLAANEELIVLNLYGTTVSDAGLAHLARLKKLRRLYLWDTNVTTEAVMALRVERPDVAIDVGENALAAVAAVEEEATSPERAPTCCEVAAAKGEECAHACCVEARKNGEVCLKCNPHLEDKSDGG